MMLRQLVGIGQLQNDEPIVDRETMRQATFEYIEVDNNLTWRHSAFGYVSPAVFEQQLSA